MGKTVHITSRYGNLLVSFVIVTEMMICAALFFIFSSVTTGIPEEGYLQSLVLISAIYTLVAFRNGVGMHMRRSQDYEVVLVVLKNVFYYSVLSVVLLHVGRFYVFRWPLYIVYLITLFICLLAFRYTLRFLSKRYHQLPKHRRKLILIGSGHNNRELYAEFVNNDNRGYDVLGYFDDNQNAKMSGAKYLGKIDDVIPYLKNGNGVQEVYCCLPYDYRHDAQQEIISYCENNFKHFFVVPLMSKFNHQNAHLNVLGSVPYMSFFDDPLNSTGNRVVKRAFDIVFSLIFLLTVFPIVFVIVAIITKITMPGPIFFKQKRSGINGKEFTMYKFRSMKVNDDADKKQATKNDPRKTKWGNIMRKTNIDEIPQFINVLLGDMSVVGPRPHMLKHTEEYSQVISHYMIRHYIKPGITGWSQVTGFRGETTELKQMVGRVKGDIWYMEHWSLWLDIYIVFRTVYNAIVGDEKAY